MRTYSLFPPLTMVACLCLLAMPALARQGDQISIVGSSTVYPFATIVAERFGKSTRFRTPVIEATGSGGGIKLFCAGIGLDYPDVTNASRKIKASEHKTCTQNGISVTEFIIGNDGIAFSNALSGVKFDISIAHIAAALMARLPGGGMADTETPQKLMKNALSTWADVDAYVAAVMGTAPLGLPAQTIRVMVPPPSSGTRDAMGALFMKAGAKKLGLDKIIDAEALREDGAAIEVGENDNLIIEKLASDPDLFGIFGYSFFDQNRDKVQASNLDGVALDFDMIASYAYPGARPLYSYVKREHLDVVPGLRDYFKEFISPRATGSDGYLFPAGLVPLSEADLAAQKAKLKTFPALKMDIH